MLLISDNAKVLNIILIHKYCVLKSINHNTIYKLTNKKKGAIALPLNCFMTDLSFFFAFVLLQPAIHNIIGDINHVVAKDVFPCFVQQIGCSIKANGLPYQTLHFGFFY